MSQLGRNINVARLPPIKMPWFDNSELIRSLGKTLIGRVTNPDRQNVESLVSMLPKLWKLDDSRVTVRSFDEGKFFFDFKREEDIIEVLNKEPFSFNQWMVSIVRWKPVSRNTYPSDITFWVRMIGVPVGFSTDQDLRRLGNEIGTVREVNAVNTMVKVTIDSTIPLCFKISFQFETGGDMVDVKMEYEKLVGYCATCFSLCHDEESCPENNLHEEDYLSESDYEDA